MKTIWNKLFIVILSVIASCAKPPIELNKLQKENNYFFHLSPNEPFSGTAISKHETGITKLQGGIKNGLKEGRWVKYYKNGQKN